VLRETVSRIEQRMASYEQMLHGVQGLVAATGSIDRGNQFRDYVNALNLDANFSGIQAISIEEWVPAAAWMRTWRAWPPGPGRLPGSAARRARGLCPDHPARTL
jgi:CHASE1-domain containing sensor protein